jgi:hypothetical protein
VPATKFLLTTYHIKAGKQTDLTDEIKRAIAVNKKINSTISYDGFIQTMSGSSPTVVIIRHLKDGFKELDPDYSKAPADQFKKRLYRNVWQFCLAKKNRYASGHYRFGRSRNDETTS